MAQSLTTLGCGSPTIVPVVPERIDLLGPRAGGIATDSGEPWREEPTTLVRPRRWRRQARLVGCHADHARVDLAHQRPPRDMCAGRVAPPPLGADGEPPGEPVW